MNVKNKSFHEICDYIREYPTVAEVNNILRQMIPNVRHVNFDTIDYRNHREKMRRYYRLREVAYEMSKNAINANILKPKFKKTA
jgi:hypothetical protein